MSCFALHYEMFFSHVSIRMGGSDASTLDGDQLGVQFKCVCRRGFKHMVPCAWFDRRGDI